MPVVEFDSVDGAVALSIVRALVKSGAAKEIRLRHGLSLQDVADAIGADQSTVGRWERGERRPDSSVAFIEYGRLLGSLEVFA